MNNSPRKRGRPPSAKSLASAAVNYQALAWQVKQRIDNAAQEGRKLKMKDAVKEEMEQSVKERNNNMLTEYGEDNIPTRQGIVRKKLSTAYTEVRKILRGWKEAEKK